MYVFCLRKGLNKSVTTKLRILDIENELRADCYDTFLRLRCIDVARKSDLSTFRMLNLSHEALNAAVCVHSGEKSEGFVMARTHVAVSQLQMMSSCCAVGIGIRPNVWNGVREFISLSKTCTSLRVVNHLFRMIHLYVVS